MLSYHANNVALLDPLRNFLRQATEDFLSRGGEVRRFAPDVLGDPTRPLNPSARMNTKRAHEMMMGCKHER